MITGLLVGAILGFILQRARFCMTGGFRDIYLTKNNTMLYAFFIAIAIQAILVLAFVETGALTIKSSSFSLFGTVIGSLVFGIGIILAGGCATGTWYRAAEGLIGSWIALAFYMIFAAIMKYGAFANISKEISSIAVYPDSISETTGISQWVLILLFAGLTAYLASRVLRKPKLKIATLPAKRKGIAHILFEKRWHPFTAAVLIGLVAAIAWIASSASGRNGGLGITTPSANIVTFLITGNTQLIDWGVYLVLGIFIGSFIAAKQSREFKWRLPNGSVLISSMTGGILMGIGASLAGGCTIGNGLTKTAIMSWQGWISLTFTIFGVWIAAYFVYVRSRKQPATIAATV